MDDLTNDDIHSILADAQRLLPVARGETYLPLLQGRILGNLFFEPSTRTRMSFETAMKRLGGDVVNLGDVKTTICHPATSTHGRLADADRKLMGISENMIRIAVGLESVDDLIEDCERGLAAIIR